MHILVKELAGLIQMCHVQQVFNNNELYRIQFVTSPELLGVSKALLKACVQLGGTVKCLGPPRFRSDRLAAEALRKLL